jgi:hypothetical protein
MPTEGCEALKYDGGKVMVSAVFCDGTGSRTVNTPIPGTVA